MPYPYLPGFSGKSKEGSTEIEPRGECEEAGGRQLEYKRESYAVPIILPKIRQSPRRERDGKYKVLSTEESLRRENDALRRQLAEKDIHLNNLRNELQHSRTTHDELTNLLSTRTRELKDSQAFLTKVDNLSGAEIIALVEALNSEIMQTSAFISDFFDFARPTMAHLLSTVQHGGDPLLVQLALQGATVDFSNWIIATWDYNGPLAEHPLEKLYSDIWATETQAVGGRWRALTRAHARKVAMQKTDLHATMVSQFSDCLVTVMIAAGCTKSYKDASRDFNQKFGEPISNIVKMASRLNKAMGEEVMSADLWTIYVAAGQKFDGVTMEDFEGQDGNQDGKTILCATALGLGRSEKVTRGETFEYKNATLLKPKVALESVVEGLEREEA
ncbi:hypothetical protein BU15DRAFT_89829 [Melanogaster broomeanus]|nr:hypothetical protein BU15DRAFT_89829 [Melanogaster broomeanus]